MLTSLLGLFNFMSNKIYLLLKDLPNVKAGAEFEWCSTEKWSTGFHKEGRYVCQNTINSYGLDAVFAPKEVENNPIWFRLKETIKFIFIYNRSEYSIEKTPQEWAFIYDILLTKGCKYTKEDMRNCFESARLMSKCENAMCKVYKDFDEYLKLITE